MGFTINEDRGSVIVRLLFLAVLVMAGLNFMDRALREGKRVKPEASAIGSVRKLVISQTTYSETIGDGTYADSLDLLYSSNLIDSVLVSGTKDGYTFTVSTGAGNDTFAIYARPITYGETGTRSFLVDETGLIRYTAEERPATVDDKPLGQ
jgi:hypothetical protein